MYRPVYDENFLDVRQSEELTGRDGDRVEVAEAHGFLRLGVMAGRSDQPEPIGQLVGGDLLHELHHGAHSVASGSRGVELVPVSVRVHPTPSTGQNCQLVESPGQVEVLPQHLPLDGVCAEHDGVGRGVAALDLLQAGEHRDLLAV